MNQAKRKYKTESAKREKLAARYDQVAWRLLRKDREYKSAYRDWSELEDHVEKKKRETSLWGMYQITPLANPAENKRAYRPGMFNVGPKLISVPVGESFHVKDVSGRNELGKQSDPAPSELLVQPFHQVVILDKRLSLSEQLKILKLMLLEESASAGDDKPSIINHHVRPPKDYDKRFAENKRASKRSVGRVAADDESSRYKTSPRKRALSANAHGKKIVNKWIKEEAYLAIALRALHERLLSMKKRKV